MTPGIFTTIFLAALAASVAIRIWLAARQMRHVGAHRAAVPPHFAGRISLAAHQKAADYTVARTRLGLADTAIDTVLLLALTLGGGIALIASWSAALGWPPLWRDTTLIVATMLLSSLVGLPLAWYRTFVIEQRFGFNRMTLFGLDPLVISRTLEEVNRCKKQGIIINTFMLASDYGLVNFVQKVTEICRGKAYFTTPYTLGQYLLMDYMNRKTRTIH